MQRYLTYSEQGTFRARLAHLALRAEFLPEPHGGRAIRPDSRDMSWPRRGVAVCFLVHRAQRKDAQALRSALVMSLTTDEISGHQQHHTAQGREPEDEQLLEEDLLADNDTRAS